MAREGAGPLSDSRCYLVSRLDHVGVFRRSSLVPISSRMPNDKWMELGRSPTDQTAVSKKIVIRHAVLGMWMMRN